MARIPDIVQRAGTTVHLTYVRCTTYTKYMYIVLYPEAGQVSAV